MAVQIGVAISLFALVRQEKLGSIFGDTMKHSLEHFSKPGYDGVTKGEFRIGLGCPTTDFRLSLIHI